jgi:hypothetical protein
MNHVTKLVRMTDIRLRQVRVFAAAAGLSSEEYIRRAIESQIETDVREAPFMADVLKALAS